MNLQKLTINGLKETYPTITLREISSLTGLDQTRVHRIFNGHEMKLSEYQLFNNLIEKKSSTKSSMRLQTLIREATEFLDERTLNNLFLTLERKILTSKIYFSSTKETLCLTA